MRPMQSPRVRPLRHHLLLLMLLGLVPLTVFAALALSQAAQSQRDALARATLDLARAVASNVQGELEANLLALASLGRSPDLQSGDLRSFHATATALAGLHPAWSRVTLSNAEGRVLIDTDVAWGQPPGPPLDAPAIEQVIRDGEASVGPALRTDEGVVAPARMPVLRDGRVAYVLTAELPPQRLLTMLQRQQVPEPWVIAILDPGQQIFARSKRQEQFVLRTATPALQALMREGISEGTGVSRSQEGDPVVTGFSRTPDFGWRVAVGAPAGHSFATLLPSGGLYLAGVGSSLLICIALGIALARRIGRDIGQVGEAAARLGEGEPMAAPRSRIREIDRLGQSLLEASRRLGAADASMRTALAEARRAAAAKDEFLAMLGHELRNPLAPMVSALFLLDSTKDPTTERHRAILRRQLSHMKRLVDDLLDVARIARGAVEIRTEPLDVIQVLRDVLDDIHQAGIPGGETIRFAPEVEQAWVLGDAPRLTQVFTNLLRNAMVYGAGRPIDLSVTVDGDEVQVAVQDQGLGMDAPTLERLFDAFYQSPLIDQRPRGSLGLGLAIVKALVEAHGGRVLASSPGLGRGSRFELGLPAYARVVAHLAETLRLG